MFSVGWSNYILILLYFGFVLISPALCHGDQASKSLPTKQTVEPLDIAGIWLRSMISTMFISAAPFALLYIIPLDNTVNMRPRLKVILAFASGGLLGDAFLHLIPHASLGHHGHHEHTHHSESGNGHGPHSEIAVGLWVLCGIITFLGVEKIVRLIKGHHGHSHHAENYKPKDGKSKNKGEKHNAKNQKNIHITAYLNLVADFAHNFTDGLAIGASYLAGNSIGIVTTITILLHEVPHEIGDFAILIKSGCDRRHAILLQLVTAIGALAGNAFALVGVGGTAQAMPWVLPFTAGGFIYIATVSVIPELLDDNTKLNQSIKEIVGLLCGVALMVLISYFE